jgi:hypothetical protein
MCREPLYIQVQDIDGFSLPAWLQLVPVTVARDSKCSLPSIHINHPLSEPMSPSSQTSSTDPRGTAIIHCHMPLLSTIILTLSLKNGTRSPMWPAALNALT